MDPPRRRPQRRSLWQRIRRLLGRGPERPPPPEPPPDEEPALVPSSSPRRPSPAAGATLELLEEPHDVDARGRSGE